MSERTKRRANIRRGMKIAIYEIQQMLAERGGLKLELPPSFIPYTVAVAEGGRRDASLEDRIESCQWQVIRDIEERIGRLERAFDYVVIARRQ